MAIAVARAAASASDGARAVVATVLSHTIYADQLEPTAEEKKALNEASGVGSELDNFRARRLETLIVEPLRRRFCMNRDCRPTREELRAFSAAADPADSSDDHAQREEQRAAREFISSWKFRKALQERYGGEVIWEVLGPDAVEARRRWLEAEEKAGSYHIVDADLRARFYEAVSGYGGRSVPPEEAMDAFRHPPWEAATTGTVVPWTVERPSLSATPTAPLDTIGMIRLVCDGERSAIEQAIHAYEVAHSQNPTIPTKHLDGPAERPFSESVERLFGASTLNTEARKVADACLQQVRALEDRLHEMPRPADTTALPRQP